MLLFLFLKHKFRPHPQASSGASPSFTGLITSFWAYLALSCFQTQHQAPLPGQKSLLQLWKFYFFLDSSVRSHLLHKSFWERISISERILFPSPHSQLWLSTEHPPVPRSHVHRCGNLSTSAFHTMSSQKWCSPPASFCRQAKKSSGKPSVLFKVTQLISATARPKTPISWFPLVCIFQKGSWKAKSNF